MTEFELTAKKRKLGECVMKKRFLKILSLMLALAFLPGCGESEESVEASLSASAIELTMGETAALSVNDYTGDVIWSSSDPGVAAVTDTGEVSAVSIGNAAVTARIDGDATMTCIVAVKAGVSSVTKITVTSYYSSSSDITLDYSDAYSALLKASCTPSSENEKLMWSSSDERIITVDDGGYITAHANGTATVTATAVNGVHGECIVRVKNAPSDADPIEGATEEDAAETTGAAEEEEKVSIPQPLPGAQSSIVISDTKVYLDIAEDYQLTVTLSNEPEGTYVTWETTDKAIAVVKYGRIVAVGEGIAVISAVTTDGAVANCYVAVGKQAKKELQKKQ